MTWAHNGVSRSAQSKNAAVATANPAGQPLVEFDRPGLLERLNHRVRVGADGESASGIAQPASAVDTVGQVALSGISTGTGARTWLRIDA